MYNKDKDKDSEFPILHSYQQSLDQLKQKSSGQQESYQTTDITLAAWLHSQGIELLHTDISGFPFVFFFSTIDQNLRNLIRLYETATATGNIVLFFRSYKLMLSRIKDNNKNSSRNSR